MSWASARWSTARDSSWRSSRWLDETLTLGETTWVTRRSQDAANLCRPIVFVHGLVVSGTYFQPLVEFFDPRFQLYIPDLPGFGKSSRRRAFASIASIAELTAELARWLDRQQIVRAVFVANSLGCQIVTQLAVTRPDLVDRYVLISPTMDTDAPTVLHLALRALRDIPRERQSLWKIWVGDLLRAGPRLAVRTLLAGLHDPQVLRLSKVTQPGLLIGGESDPIVPPRWIREMEAHLKHARAIIIPGAPHALNFSAPRDVARIIRTAILDE